MLDGISIEKDRLRIVVIGIGGGGSNAVKNMIEQNLEGCEFCVCNTDSQALKLSPCEDKFLLGEKLTNGLGAGGDPELGRKAAEENIQDIEKFVDGADMVFLSVGMGGGTGTGASPVIAEMIKDKGIVCVCVVSKPFAFENTHRMKVAEDGIEELQKYVDTVIVIPNENLISLVSPDATFEDALKKVDDVLLMGVRAVADLTLKPGKINLDFNDIRAVVKESGKAIIGIGEVSKSECEEKTAEIAAQQAISNSLLEHNNIAEAQAVLVNVTASKNLSFMDMLKACDTVRGSVHADAHVIFGMSLDDSPEFSDIIRVSVLATGISNQAKATRVTQIGQQVVSPELSVPTTPNMDTNVNTGGDFEYLNKLEPVNVDADTPESIIESDTETPSSLQSAQADTDDVSSENMEPTDITPETGQNSDIGDDIPPSDPEHKTSDDKDIATIKPDGLDFNQDSLFQDPPKKSGGLFSFLSKSGGSTQKKSTAPDTPQHTTTKSDMNNTMTSVSELPDFLKDQRDD